MTCRLLYLYRHLQHFRVCGVMSVHSWTLHCLSKQSITLSAGVLLRGPGATGGQVAWRGVNSPNDHYSEIVCSSLYYTCIVRSVHSRTLRCLPNESDNTCPLVYFCGVGICY